MYVRYSLLKNTLNNGSNGYRAKVRPFKTVEMDEVIDRMVERGSKLVKEEIIGTLELYHSTIEIMVSEGYSVSSPLATYGTRIRGSFANRLANFEHGVHEVLPRVNATNRYRRALRQSPTAEKIAANKREPDPIEFYDKNTGEIDSVFTPGKVGILLGENLKFDESDPTQGIFFLGAGGTEEQVSVIIRNVPTELIFEIPDTIVSGEYSLEVRAKIRNGNELREGELEPKLTVS